MQIVVVQDCLGRSCFSRLLFWDKQKAALVIPVGVVMSIEGGLWKSMHRWYGLVASPATPCVAAVEWHSSGGLRWDVDFPSGPAVCEAGCVREIRQVSRDPWVELEAALDVIPKQPVVVRPNIAEQPVESTAFGLRKARDGTFWVHAPAFLRTVVALVRETLARQYRTAPFQVLQLNRGFRSRAHTDSGNLGPSFAAAVGDFYEGQMWTLDPSGATALQVGMVEGPLCACSHQLLRGRIQDHRRRWLRLEEHTLGACNLASRGRPHEPGVLH